MGFQSGDDGGLAFYINQQRNYARNDYDRTLTFVQSYVYDLPFGPHKRWLQSGLAGNIFGNWRVNGILTLMSGTPLNLTASGSSLNAPGNTQTPDQIAPVNILHGVGPNSPWFDPASFATPTTPGVFGNMGRNSFSGPGASAWMLRCSKLSASRSDISLSCEAKLSESQIHRNTAIPVQA